MCFKHKGRTKERLKEKRYPHPVSDFCFWFYEIRNIPQKYAALIVFRLLTLNCNTTQIKFVKFSVRTVCHSPSLPLHRHFTRPPRETEEGCQPRQPHKAQSLQQLRANLVWIKRIYKHLKQICQSSIASVFHQYGGGLPNCLCNLAWFLLNK